MCFGALPFLSLHEGLRAGTYTDNFDTAAYDATSDPQPPGAALYGNAVIELSGGFAGGALKLTKAAGNQKGTFLIEDLDGGAAVNAFTATFKVRVGGGTTPPADGWSFCFGPDVTAGTWPGEEEGDGTGLIVAFDTYDNGGAEAPAITIRYGGAQVAEVKPGIDALLTGENDTPLWADARIQLHPDGTLDVELDGVAHFTRLSIPFTETTVGGFFAFGGRTGGATANHYIDDLNIVTSTGPLRAGFVHQPQSSTFVTGQPVRFHTLVTSEEVALGYQWERQGPGGGTFTAVTGATDRDFVGAAATAADQGAKYRLAVQDEGGVVYSDEVTLTVANFPEPAYSYSESFNTDPANGSPYGDAFIDTGAGQLILTTAENAKAGSFVIADQNAGEAVAGITVAFDVLMSQGGDPDPDGVVVADGMSFNWAPDVTEGAGPVEGAAEQGSGSGLRLCFDVYDNTDANPYNGRGEGPALLLKWGSTVLASVMVTPAELNTGVGLIPVVLQLAIDGRVSVSVNGRLYFQDVPVPSWTALSGGKYAFYARTGGANQQHVIDNVRIEADTYSGPVQITDEADDTAVLVGEPATFAVVANYAVPPATVQWQRKGAADADFADIAGATSLTYTTPAATAADNGALYRATVQLTAGNAGTSREALLSVIDFSHASPQVVLEFEGSLANTGSASATVPEATTLGAQDGVERELVLEPSGGPDGSGYLAVTDAVNGQAGLLVVENYAGDASQGAMTATFDVNFATGTDTPADGFSFNWGADVPTTLTGTAEEGVGTGLSVTFDVYGADAPAIGIKYNGAFVIDLIVPASIRPADWAAVGIKVSNNGQVDVMLDNHIYHHGVQLPGWAGLANGRFSFFARTGGLNQNHWVDNLRISSSNYVGPILFTQQPVNTAALYGQPATFTAAVNDPGQTTWSWETAAAGSSAFGPIAGANTAAYTTAAVAAGDQGRQYRAVATGAGNTITSNVVVLTAVDPTLPAPSATLDFDNASLLSYAFAGGSFEETFDGVDNSGVAKITTAENDQAGRALLVDDFNGGSAVESLVAAFQVAVGGGSTPPADGYSFVWAPDISTASAGFGEEGTGNGLVVSFDTYTNGAGDDSGITVRWQGENVIERKLPWEALLSPSFPEYMPVVIKLDADGTIDVWYNQRVIFHDVPVPGFVPLANAGFGWGGRTGGLNENVWIDNINLTTVTAGTPDGDIAIQRNGNNIVVTFSGTLQHSETLTGWADLTGQTSPYVFPVGTGPRFFRIKPTE